MDLSARPVQTPLFPTRSASLGISSTATESRNSTSGTPFLRGAGVCARLRGGNDRDTEAHRNSPCFMVNCCGAGFRGEDVVQLNWLEELSRKVMSVRKRLPNAPMLV